MNENNIWEVLTSISTFLAVLVALFLPMWKDRIKLHIVIKFIDDRFSYLIENKSNRSIKVTDIEVKLLQVDGLYNRKEWKSYNFYNGDKINDSFYQWKNEEVKKKEHEQYIINPRDGLIKEHGKLLLGFMQNTRSSKEHKPHETRLSLVWLKVTVHTGKTFFSIPKITRIYKNTEIDDKSPNFKELENEEYYEYDRFGNLVHEPPSEKEDA